MFGRKPKRKEEDELNTKMRAFATLLQAEVEA
jgi:ribosomal protein L4